MEQFTSLTSSMMPLPFNDVDTDQIIPASYLKVINKEGLVEGLFSRWRYQADGEPDPDFVLNQPRFSQAHVLVAGDNFGCGSSREHAPWALMGWGFRAVISTSFADIFRNNSLKNGLLPIQVDEETQRQLLSLAEEDPDCTIAIDLASQTVTLPDGRAGHLPHRRVLQDLPAAGRRPAGLSARAGRADCRVRSGPRKIDGRRLMADQVFIYDTTLRDGTQREGISLSLADKLKITRRLDEFGVHYIEGGWPGSNPKDVEYFQAVRDLPLRNARIAAFGATRRKHAPVADDDNIRALLDAETPVVTVVGKSWDLHVYDVLETDLEENLAMIGDSVAYLKDQGREVIYDAEHFFDGYKANPEYALLTVKVAAEHGADTVVLCDTNGGSLPWEIDLIVRRVADVVDAPIGIHTHDDSGCGVANSLAAVAAGAVQVQGTINGYGERVGNANLCTIIPDLQLKMGRSCVPEEGLRRLVDLSHFVAEVANLTLDTHLPYVGHSAFAHKGGIHVAAMRKNEDSYQHVDPGLVGNQKRTVISELSGRGNVLDKATEYGIDVNSAQARDVLQQIKRLESQGFAFESAEASISLMLRRLLPDYTPPFELLDFTVLVQHRADRGVGGRRDGQGAGR